MYKIKRQHFGNREMLMMQSGNETASLSIVPSFGANILSLRLEKNSVSCELLQGFKTEAALTDNEKSRSILLAPFPNRIRDGKYIFGGKQLQLPVNKPDENNAIHGFIWNRPFTVVSEDTNENSASLEMEHRYRGDYEGYPFRFDMRLQCTLQSDRFSLTMTVTNTGTEALPFGAGWHPYFTFHKPVERLKLKLPSCNLLETDARLIPTDNKSKFTSFETLTNIGDAKFDSAFQLTGKTFETQLTDSDAQATIAVQQDAGFRYLQVYIPPDRNSIAIEPMTCPANAFNSGEGLILLKPGEAFSGNIVVKLM